MEQQRYTRKSEEESDNNATWEKGDKERSNNALWE
jgi:hypothetical protein